MIKLEILGVYLDSISLIESLSFISWQIKQGKQTYIATVNPEFIIEAQNDESFRNILNQAGLAICDGFGLKLAAMVLYSKRLIRVTGVDLTQAILDAKNENFKIYLLGGGEGVAQAVKEKYSQAKIVGAESGGKLDFSYNLEDNIGTIERINRSKANIVLVAFGQVKQEMWIAQNLSKLVNINVAIGVGGTFDYLSGQVSRPPKIIRQLGLEWLYRLVTQPKRASRIFNATVKFSWLVVKSLLAKS